MSTQTLFGHSFPTPCQQCGGALYRQLDYCPYCGTAHPLDAGPHQRTAIPRSRAGALSKAAQTLGFDLASSDGANLPARTAVVDDSIYYTDAALPGSALVSADTAVSPLVELPVVTPHGMPQIRKMLYGIGTIVMIGLAFIGYELSTDHDLSNGNLDRSAESENSQDARTITGTIAQYVPAPSANRGIVVDKAAAQVNSARPVQVIPATPIAPPAAVAPVKPAPQFHDAAQALQTARLAFRANDLSSAQAALGAAQMLQPDSADALDFAAELKPLAMRRDAALQAAQTCASQQSWACARQHADEALAIDTGNETAKSILQRVIRETGWAPLDSRATAAASSQAKQSAMNAPLSQQIVQVQAPSAGRMPPNGEAVTSTPHPAAAGADGNGGTAREHAIRDSGWNRSATSAPATSVDVSTSQ